MFDVFGRVGVGHDVSRLFRMLSDVSQMEPPANTAVRLSITVPTLTGVFKNDFDFASRNLGLARAGMSVCGRLQDVLDYPSNIYS